MDLRALISILADGEFHSGSEIGAELGVSRTAVWKALSRLAEYGLEPESIKGKGYRLIGGVDLLDEQDVLDALPPALKDRCSLEFHLSIDSTNQYVLDNEGVDRPYHFVFSEQQLAGRGRRGRSWVSPFAKNVYMSLGFDLQGGVEALSGLSLVVGIAGVRAIKACCDLDVMLKWPNDIWLDDKKVAGILVELRGEATTAWRVVAGIGINVDMLPEDGAGIDQPWFAIGPHLDCSRSEFVAKLIEEMVLVLDSFQEKGLGAFLEEWQKYDLLFGRQVTVSTMNQAGMARGIDNSGALLVDIEGRLESINAGEVSVRPHES